MKLIISENVSKYEWNDRFALAMWETREECKKTIYYKAGMSKKKLLMEISKLTNIPEEIVLILSNITELIGIIYYKKEKELEIVIGSSISNQIRITFYLKDFAIYQWLEDLAEEN